MNTTKKGNDYEENAYSIIQKAIANGDLCIDSSKVVPHKKKKYYSKDRGSNIIFDISLEIWPNNAKNYLLLFIIECKSYYPNKIPINDIEEFYAKVIQVSGLNAKGIFITDATLQSGALKYAQSKGIMVIQTNNHDYDIILHKDSKEENYEEDFNYISEEINEKDVIEKKIHTILYDLFLPLNKRIFGLEYYKSSDLKAKAMNALNDFDPYILKDYKAIDIKKFILFLKSQYNIECDFDSKIIFNQSGRKVLGYFDSSNNTIRIDKDIVGTNRFNFILAHEFGHYILHKDLKMDQRIYNSFKDSEYNFRLGKNELTNSKNWIEWQANQFAVSFLIPDECIKKQLVHYQRRLDINHNLGKIYIDSQPENIANSYAIFSFLSRFFGVSRTTIIFKLKSLDCIVSF